MGVLDSMLGVDGSDYSGIDRLMQQHGGKQYHTGDDVGAGMAFDRPYMGTSDPSTWGQKTGPFGSVTGPQDGSWYVPDDVYNQISPQTSSGGFFSDIPTALGDMKGGLSVAAMPFGVSGLEQAGMIGMPDGMSSAALSSAGEGAGGLDSLASVDQNAYLPQSMQTMTDSPVYDTVGAGAGGEGTGAGWEDTMGNEWAAAQADGLNASGGEPSIWDSVLDKAGSASDWMEKHKMATMAGLGLGLGGLQMYGAAQSRKQNQKSSDQMRADRLARQQQMDNPPPYAGMSGAGLQRPAFSPIDLAGLNHYGSGPEHNFYPVAHGGPPTSHESRPMGAFEQYVGGNGGGQDDTVPAMLSPKEYVVDADVVSALGDGNPDHGAKRLDEWRERIRQHKRAAPTHKIPPKARAPEDYMRRAA